MMPHFSGISGRLTGRPISEQIRILTDAIAVHLALRRFRARVKHSKTTSSVYLYVERKGDQVALLRLSDHIGYDERVTHDLILDPQNPSAAEASAEAIVSDIE